MQIFLNEICFKPDEIGIDIIEKLENFLRKERSIHFYFTENHIDFIVDKLENNPNSKQEDLLLLNLEKLRKKNNINETLVSYKCRYYLPFFQEPKLLDVTSCSVAECTERLYNDPNEIYLVISYPSCECNINAYTNVIRREIENGKINLSSIPTIDNIDDIEYLKKWFYKNITLKECLLDSYNLVCKELENPNSVLSTTLKNFDFETWNPSEIYFPLIQFSNYLFPNQNASLFIDQQRNLRQDKGNIRKINEKFAKINGYVLDECVKSANTNGIRYIYKAGNGKQRIYISTDFESTEFEVCNFEGEWLGSYGYFGTETKPLKSMKKREKEKFASEHSIKVPEKCK